MYGHIICSLIGRPDHLSSSAATCPLLLYYTEPPYSRRFVFMTITILIHDSIITPFTPDITITLELSLHHHGPTEKRDIIKVYA